MLMGEIVNRLKIERKNISELIDLCALDIFHRSVVENSLCPFAFAIETSKIKTEII